MSLTAHKGGKMPSILGSGAGCDPGVLFLCVQHRWMGGVKGGIFYFCLDPYILLRQQRKTGSESWYAV